MRIVIEFEPAAEGTPTVTSDNPQHRREISAEAGAPAEGQATDAGIAASDIVAMREHELVAERGTDAGRPADITLARGHEPAPERGGEETAGSLGPSAMPEAQPGTLGEATAAGQGPPTPTVVDRIDQELLTQIQPRFG